MTKQSPSAEIATRPSGRCNDTGVEQIAVLQEVMSALDLMMTMALICGALTCRRDSCDCRMAYNRGSYSQRQRQKSVANGYCEQSNHKVGVMLAGVFPIKMPPTTPCS